jgi:hypothetical protein
MAYFDCSSAITRATQALSPIGTAVGHLQHGSLLLGIRQLSCKHMQPASLMWTESHPERRKPQSTWTAHDCDIHMADAIAGTWVGIHRVMFPTSTVVTQTKFKQLSPPWDIAVATLRHSF